MAEATKLPDSTKTADVEEKRTDVTDKLSVRARARVSALADSADCEVRSMTSPIVIPRMHRVILAMESKVLRSLIESFKPCAWVKLTEAADALALLVSLIYDRNMVDSLPTSDLEEALRLCDKFDLPDVRAAAERVIVNMKLTTDNFTHWLEVARRFHLDAALENCLKYAEAPDNFSPLFAEKGEDWLKSLDEPMQLCIAFPALREAYSKHGRLRKRPYPW